MNKILKLGFAMGGGVSLGTFSGAALAEAIKQAILRAGYTEDGSFKNYDHVLIDVFAGASAGSMSLAIMLRGLVHQTDEELATAENNLKDDEAIGWNNLSHDQRENLKVAEVVRNLQADIWINEIDIEKLLGTTPEQKANLVYEAGILRRGALEDIAKKYFSFDQSVYDSKFERRKILADEVIFGSTLANLTAVDYNCSPQQAGNPANFAGAADAFTSSEHKELRVFHLFFGEQAPDDVTNNPQDYPAKWVRYHTGPKKPGFFGDLCNKDAWSRMVATSLACGAFPFAFEPVVLERFDFEYGSDWPQVLTQKVCTLATGREDGISYPFTYMDGGTFNNEPVREAFRMASYLDAGDERDFDRVIVFVDPSVSADGMNFRIPVHQTYSVKSPRLILGALEGHDLVHRATIDRLLPHLSTLVTMIVDEGRVNENDKIGYVYDLLARKPFYYQMIADLINNATVNEELIDRLKTELDNILKDEKLNEIVPEGSLTTYNELIRTIKDDPKAYKDLLDNDIQNPYSKIKAFVKNGTGAIDAGLYKLLLRALYSIFIDLLLNLSGKSQAAKIIAVAPVVDDGTGGEKIVELPGDYLYAFSGFTSKLPNFFEANLASYCTKRLMEKLGLFDKNFLLKDAPTWSDDEQKAYEQEYRSKLIEIDERIDSLLLNTKVIDLFPDVNKVILSQVSNAIQKALASLELKNDPCWSFILMVPVNDTTFEIDGSGSFNDLAPVEINGQLYLVTELSYYHTRKDINDRWFGTTAQNNMLVIDKDGFAFFPDSSFCKIDLPLPADTALANLMPNPRFVYRKMTDDDSGRILPADDWTIDPGVNIIERTLLG
jgi:predicted acylesterase/phospholipase RssA